MSDEDQSVETTDDFPIVDFSQWENPEEPASSQPSEPANGKSDSEYPGTWSPILDVLPKEFHAQVAPTLKDWDRGVSQRFEKVREEAANSVREQYKQFDRFQQSGIDPAYLETSYRIAQNLEADPVQFLENLKEMLKAEGRYTEAAQVQQAQENMGELDPNDPVAQKLTNLEKQQQQFLQAIQTAAETQQQQEQEAYQQQIRAEAEQSIEGEIAALEAKLGKPLAPQYKMEVIARTKLLFDRGNPDATIEDGYRDMVRFITATRNARPGANAPRIASSGGGNGLPAQQPASLKTASDRMAAAMAIRDAMPD